MMESFLRCSRVLVFIFIAAHALGFEQPIHIINDLRDFKPLFFDDNVGYYVSNKKADMEHAGEVCASLGENFHLVTFEDEDESRMILPFLRGLEIDTLWTSGARIQSSNFSSTNVWTQPGPSFPMNYTNFKTLAMLARLRKHSSEQRRELPRCKNGYMVPKCDPINCHVTLENCTTVVQPCTLDPVGDCNSSRPKDVPCRASCNDCKIEQPVCHVVQKPCEVAPSKCLVVKPICSISEPICETIRDPCETFHPPCQVNTPKPCLTTQRPCQTTTTTPAEEPCTTTKPPCPIEGKCSRDTNVTFCKKTPTYAKNVKKNCGDCDCEDCSCGKPEICQPGAIICPSPIIICPPEKTICQPPVITCSKPIVNCQEPVADCPEPEVKCTGAKVTCGAPEISCPGVVITCPRPTYKCPRPQVTCPPPKTECEPRTPCEFSSTPTPCPWTSGDYIDVGDVENVNEDFDLISAGAGGFFRRQVMDAESEILSGCVALKKEMDFQWEVRECSEEMFFLCEGH